MAWLARTSKGRVTMYLALLGGIALGAFLHAEARAAPYVSPFWANNSMSQESAIDMVADRAIVCESGDATAAGGRLSIDLRTGEVFYDLFLFNTPGVVEDNVFALRWRSMISGSSQLGNGVLPSWETTVEYVVLDAGNPNGNGGHKGVVRWPSGRTSDFVWNGSAYVGPSDVFHALTTVSGNFRLTDKWGNRIDFDAQGMPATWTDRNGNAERICTTKLVLRRTARIR